jgi:hypothetical protein
MDNSGGGAVAIGLLCLLATTWAAASQDGLVQDRFKVDGSPNYLRGMSLMNHVDDFTILIPVDEYLKEEDSLKDIYTKLHRMYESYGKNEESEEIYIAFRAFSFMDLKNHDGLCSIPQIKAFLFFNQVDQNLTPAELALKRYVNHYAPEKFKRCAEAIRPNIEKGMHEEKLDEFFKRLFGLPNAADDSELYSRVKDINLLENELEFDRTLEMFGKKTRDPTEEAQLIKDFIFDHCSNFSFQGEPLILVNALGLASETDPRLQKLIEYDHICWYVTRGENSMELFENIKRQLELARPQKPSFNLGCLGAICARN